MRTYTELKTINEVDRMIQEHALSFLYISKTNCSVCHALLPKIQQMMIRFPEIEFGHVNADEIEAIAGHFSIFTVPVLLLFGDGKELVREARFVHVDELEDKLEKIYSLFLK
ncbi:thioredoxin [Jeotgalibacillus sp. S-D1]|uniref:thioredoxin family protein n=1 Tax=Jeotgalibacillus sp. S-D1 TaxID=2552189 RepID=UPI00105988BA|nr:thioredoxin family protein [Jeotgalibacillus sp. S-D1]TDL31917.1 thioredoxin [Jeotgalibacillus sp. S-D1]